jgi:hypothetical protein
MKPQNSKTRKTPKCAYCGKTLINGTCGKLCAMRIDKGETPETRKIALKNLQLAQPPANWCKIAQIGRLCENANIPVSRLVRSFGGDTPNGTYNATPAIMGVIYVGKTRYCNPFWATKTGLQVIANGKGKIPETATPQYAHNLCNPQPKTPQPPATPKIYKETFATLNPPIGTPIETPATPNK